jgi:hypothetical protein
MSPSPRDALLRQVVARAVTAPPSLFLLSAGSLLAVSPHAWALGLGLLGAELGYLWWRIRDPSHAHQSQELLERRRWRDLITQLEAAAAASEEPTASSLAAIVESQERLLAFYGSDGLVVPHTRTELASLLRHCLTLAQKRVELQTHRASFSEADLRRELAQVEGRLARAADEGTRALYSQALEQKRQELANHAELAAAVERIDGQLAVVQCTFDNLLSKVIRLQATDPLTPAPERDPVFEELTQLNTRVAELEASLGETVTLRGA